MAKDYNAAHVQAYVSGMPRILESASAVALCHRHGNVMPVKVGDEWECGICQSEYEEATWD